MKVHYAPKYLINPSHRITVTVVGVGGNGTQALHDLAKINSSLVALGHPGLFVRAIDPDIVETPNLGRQEFSKADLGCLKVEVIISRINRFHGLDWEATAELFSKNQWKGSNIIISCVDNVKARKEINEAFVGNKLSSDYLRKYYWLDFGNSNKFGQFILGSFGIDQPESDKHETVPMLPTVIDEFPNMKDDDNNDSSCSTREALIKQDLFVNSLVVTHGMNLLWKLFKEYKINHRGGYVNLDKGIVSPIKL